MLRLQNHLKDVFFCFLNDSMKSDIGLGYNDADVLDADVPANKINQFEMNPPVRLMLI